MIRLVSPIVSARLRAAVMFVSIGLPTATAWVALQPSVVVAQEAPAKDPMVSAAEDFWHFGKIARYDLANEKAKEVIAAGTGDKVKLLSTFEKIADDRGDNLDEWLIRWQGVADLKETANQLATLVNEGRFERRALPDYIDTNIARLGSGDRPYRLALVQLRESGELAVAPMLAVLNDPAKQALHGPVRRAILDLGRAALNPLVAATESTNEQQVEMVVSLLGQLGYDAAVPYLVRVVEKGPSENIKVATQLALKNLQYNGGASGDLFYDLAEKLYYEKSSLVADNRFPTANIWREEAGKGLMRAPVAPAIFNEVMSMRAAERALSTGSTGDALSLWLAANYKREAELPAGEKDTTRTEGQPDAHYYGVTAGTQYLNATLSRALRDNNSAVALGAVKSLQQIVGDANFKTDGGASPLIDAMQYGDRRVRFEAAFTLAQALPQTAFVGQDLVVPLLAEAVSQTGQPSVLAVMPSQEAINSVVEPLKSQGFIATGATNAASALSAAATLPAIDVVLISDDLAPAEIESLLGLIGQSPKTRAAAKLFIVKSNATQWEARKASDPTISTTTTTDTTALKEALTSARVASGALPLDPELATQYATRAGELIKKLAISRGQVLDLSPARSTLLGALEDTRPAVVKLAGEGLGLLDNADAQKGLLLKATTEATVEEVKISLFQSLATSAKFFGNKLDPQQIEALDTAVKSATTPAVKSAAAEARGALNLPSEQAKALILGQAGL